MSKQSVKPTAAVPWWPLSAVANRCVLWPVRSASGSPRLPTGSSAPKASVWTASIGPTARTPRTRPAVPNPLWKIWFCKSDGNWPRAIWVPSVGMPSNAAMECAAVSA